MNRKSSVTLINPHGKLTEVKMGYSFTTLLFHMFPDLLRSFYRGFIISMVGCITLYCLTSVYGFSGDYTLLCSLAFGVYGLYRNKILINFYLDNGWKIVENNPIEQQRINYFMRRVVDESCYYEESGK